MFPITVLRGRVRVLNDLVVWSVHLEVTVLQSRRTSHPLRACWRWDFHVPEETYRSIDKVRNGYRAIVSNLVMGNRAPAGKKAAFLGKGNVTCLSGKPP